MDFKTVLTALDLSPTDHQLIEYVSKLAPLLDMKQLYFMHIAKDLANPENADLAFHKNFTTDYPLDEKVRGTLQQEVGRSFENPADYGIAVEVHEGKPYQKLLHWAEVKNADLIVIGQKESESTKSGITARKLAHRCASNLLIIPENIPSTIQRITVPIDFSERSAKALRLAIDLAKRSAEPIAITALNVIETLSLSQYPGEYSYMEAVQAFKAANERAFAQMLKEYSIEARYFNMCYLENPYHNVATQLQNFLKENPTDLILFGAKNHSHFENFLFGSVTEQFVKDTVDTPVLILR